MFNVGGQKVSLGAYHDEDIAYADYLDNFLMPLWMQLRRSYANKKDALARSIASVIGATNPTEGLSRSLVTLLNHRIEPVPKSRPFRDDARASEHNPTARVAAGVSMKSAPPVPPPPPEGRRA